ncbi:uncharacterized protein [Dermacentor albipictus]|uniref:uncharacterized protein n=1 Tax=Dermacentor albipictus TaxID=60249 RepID=UPI0038FD1147
MLIPTSSFMDSRMKRRMKRKEGKASSPGPDASSGKTTRAQQTPKNRADKETPPPAAPPPCPSTCPPPATSLKESLNATRRQAVDSDWKLEPTTQWPSNNEPEKATKKEKLDD